MTLFELRAPEDLLAVRFAVSPVWETQAAVQAFVDERGRSYHEPWLGLVRAGGTDPSFPAGLLVSAAIYLLMMRPRTRLALTETCTSAAHSQPS
jgi:hypothetical protein